jgi:bacteriorhodopsin
MAERGAVKPETVRTMGRRRYWNWLLAVPLVLLVYPGLYARTAPELFGFPFFYWYQFAVVVATALLTGVVYWLTRNRAEESPGKRRD